MNWNLHRYLLFLVAWLLALPVEAGGAFRLDSPAFPPGGMIPPRYTCDGADVSPPLRWAGIPRGTRSLVLIIEDPDAPDPAAPRTIWTHWILYNLPPGIGGLPEAVPPAALPPGTRQGLNDWKRPGYGGPCPPIGTHRYFHRLYALDVVLPNLGPVDRKGLLRAMQGHVLGVAELVGRYHRQ
ncbi:MAG: YbhB/YbcL family Raf kinase inhibitor-like protein [Gammaproteobacteria bacterium]|nr:MAG: YbhB/YbcL family Raf kinase inhibitor-like protein [Gammaproteobacteria bacterium]